jgi:hypothetical protein
VKSTRRSKTPRSDEAALEERLRKRLGRLDHRAIVAVLTILDLMARCDHRRVTQLIEAVAMLVTFAPPKASGRRRSRGRTTTATC